MAEELSFVEQVRALRGAKMHDGFRRVIDEIISLHEAKGADYGSDSDPFANVRASQDFGIEPWVGAVMRSNDKMVRIKNFCKRGNLVNEPIRDSIRDVAVYFCIALMLYDEANHAASG